MDLGEILGFVKARVLKERPLASEASPINSFLLFSSHQLIGIIRARTGKTNKELKECRSARGK